ncbi:MAG TPA: zinc ribbon domain-containing protein, partial [Stenomitos sp.]
IECLHIHPVKEKFYHSGKTFKCEPCGWHGDADFNGAKNIALVRLFINPPGGMGLSCKLNRTIEYVGSLWQRLRRTA